MEIGIALALVAGLMTNLAALLKHRGCHRLEPVRIRQPLRSARTLVASPWFAAGWGLAAVSPTPLGIALQATAFAMVCLSALLMPARRAAAVLPA